MFTKALYYPWIDIRDENWLKTAALYWKKIHTIVPESIDFPYSSESAQIMQDANILEPIRVHPRMRELKDIVPEFLGYLSTDEGLRVLMYDHKNRSLIHPDKFDKELREILDISRFHPDKLHLQILGELLENLNARMTRNGWLEMPTTLANYYMTLLANKLCATKGVAVVSDYSIYDQLSLKIKNGRIGQQHGAWNRRRIPNNDRYTPYAEALADGILAQIVLESVCIKSDIRIDKILEFREKHQDSFDSFRGAIQDLAATLYESNNIDTLGALRERLKSIHTNKIKPNIEMIERKLNENFISTVIGNFSFAGMASILSLGPGVASFPVIGPYALLAGAGISIVVTSYLYSRRKRELQEEPFSYVLSVKKEFGFA